MCYQDIFYCILDLPDSRLHLVLQQDRQVCGRFGIFSVAHLKFQTHHNEDKRQNPCCDKRNLISLVTLILIASRFVCGQNSFEICYHLERKQAISIIERSMILTNVVKVGFLGG